MRKLCLKKISVEIIVIVLYTVLHVLLSLNHEGCFDEVHAWNIARDGSFIDIIFKVPHIEGHPSLWHLILFPFAKLGLAYKTTACIITTVFTFLSVFFIEIKAPFGRLIKVILPFTYFVFYQYGIIARPYCMMVLAFVLVAVFYKDRDIKPIRYTLSMVFLCATSAFGTVVAGGIALVWIKNIVKDNISSGPDIKSSGILKDVRIYCLMGLLFYAVFLIFRILPLNPYGGMNYNGIRENGVLIRGLYLFLGLFADLFFTNTYTHDFLADFTFNNFELLSTCLIGGILLLGILVIGKKTKKLLEFLCPYVLLSLFSMFIYFGVHNSGILFLLVVYWFWISWEDILKKKILHTNKYLSIPSIVLLALPVFWSISAGITDLKYTYSFGENEARFLIDNNLENSEILFEWKNVIDETKLDSLEGYDMKHIINMDRLYAYMDHPRFINWPLDYSLYVNFHLEVTEDENIAIIRNLREHSDPEVLIGEPDMSLLKGKTYRILDDYILAYTGRIVKPWKNMNFNDESKIYLRRTE